MSTNPSVVQQFASWAKKIEGEIQDGLTKVFGPTTAQKVEAASIALLKSALGALALQAVQSATDVQSGKVNVGQAVSTLEASSVAAGKAVANGAATQLIAAAQSALEAPHAPPTT